MPIADSEGAARLKACGGTLRKEAEASAVYERTRESEGLRESGMGEGVVMLERGVGRRIRSVTCRN